MRSSDYDILSNSSVTSKLDDPDPSKLIWSDKFYVEGSSDVEANHN